MNNSNLINKFIEFVEQVDIYFYLTFQIGVSPSSLTIGCIVEKMDSIQAITRKRRTCKGDLSTEDS